MLSGLLAAATSAPDKPAIVQDGRSVSYAALARARCALAGRLARAGLRAGQAVALQAPGAAEFAAGLLGAWRAGLAVLPLEAGLKAAERDRYAARAGAAAVLGSESLPMPSVEQLQGDGEPDTGPGLAAGATALLLLSSGSTGEPKVVVRPAERVAAAAGVFRTALPVSGDDRVLGVLPLYHAAGLFNVLLSTLARGATLHAESFEPRRTIETIRRERITVLIASPFMYRMLSQVRLTEPPDVSSLRLAYSGTGPMTTAILRAFEERFGLAITQGYGTTETNAAAVTRPGERIEHPGLVGRPYPGIDVEIRDEAGRPLGPGGEGVVCIRSPGAGVEYLGDGQATAETFRDGWVVTGDLGRLDEAGGLTILGRRRAMLNVAGRKVAPAEVEACLRGHPAVAEVAVTGVPGPDGYDRIVARVAATGPVTAQQLRDFAAGQLAEFKIPRQFEFVASLGRGPLGKPAAPEAQE